MFQSVKIQLNNIFLLLQKGFLKQKNYLEFIGSLQIPTIKRVSFINIQLLPFLGAFLPYSVFVNLEVGINSLMIRKSSSFSSTSYFLQLMLERKLGVRINCKANFNKSKQKHTKNTHTHTPHTPHTHIYIVKYNTQFYFCISRGRLSL